MRSAPAQVGPQEHRTAQVGAAQVGGPEVGTRQVGTGEVAPALVRRPGGLGDRAQGRRDAGAQVVDVRLGRRGAGGEALGLGDQGRDVGAPVGGVGEVPGDLVHLLDDEEVRDPVGLGDRLAGAEAVVGHAAAHARLAETVVDAAAGVGGEVPARRARRLVEREVRRPREGQDHAAQPDAAGAVGGQLHGVRVSRAGRRARR